MVLLECEYFFDVLKIERVLVNVLENFVLLEVHPAQMTSAYTECISAHMLYIDYRRHS